MKKMKQTCLIAVTALTIGLSLTACGGNDNTTSEATTTELTKVQNPQGFDENKKVVSIGYNGMPMGCDESKLSWNKGTGLDSKYLYVCHAEFNAILNTRNGTSALKGCTVYVTLFPCNECTKAIIQTGIKEVVYISNKYENTTETQASLRMLMLAGIKIRHYEGRIPTIEYDS